MKTDCSSTPTQLSNDALQGLQPAVLKGIAILLQHDATADAGACAAAAAHSYVQELLPTTPPAYFPAWMVI
jgi:RecJ-like exonuclease